ncbi:hypothetical protein RIF29_26966 [Crotalaria pallida]|uniref:Uncharacterized protein n=1 Tax=Crotalaria pallida TaxID=3830 RepID=A0AAN9EN94_CROPI
MVNVGTRNNVETQLMGDLPPITLVKLIATDKLEFCTVSRTIVGISFRMAWFKISVTLVDSTMTTASTFQDRDSKFHLKLSCANLPHTPHCTPHLVQIVTIIGNQYNIKVEVKAGSNDEVGMRYYIHSIHRLSHYYILEPQ